MMKYFLILNLIFGISVGAYAADVTNTAPVATSTVEVAAEAPTEALPDKPIKVMATSHAEKLNEEQIPLALANEKQTTESNEALATVPRALASGFIIILLLGVSYYYVSKYKISNKINKSNMHIKVLSQHYLGPKKSLAVIHVAGESILLGVTETNISMLKSLSLIDDEVPSELPNTFNESINKTMEKNEKYVASATNREELEEEFSFSGVTDTVSKKIKSMRSFS